MPVPVQRKVLALSERSDPDATGFVGAFLGSGAKGLG